jgi:D-inositol-3-phosphate glycosyltransferase
MYYKHNYLLHPQKQETVSQNLNTILLQFSSLHSIALLCFSDSEGGLELTTIRLAEELQQRGAPTLVVTLPKSSLMQWSADKQITAIPLKPKIKYGDIVTARRIGIAFRQHNIEAVIVMRSADIHLAVLAKHWHPSLRIVFYQQMQSGINKRDALHTWLYSHLDLWMTLTESMRVSVLENTRMCGDHVEVAHLGRDTNEFHPNVLLQDEARKLLHLPAKKIIIGMLGRLDQQKGQKELLRSIPLIQQQYPDVYFVIAGDETKGASRFKQELLALIQTLGVEGSVQLLPSMQDVRIFLSAIDIFVMPSYSETYGLVLIEAMAMEKPVIATNSGGVPEIIRHGQDGFLVPPKNITALAVAILYYLNNQQRRRKFAQNARERAVRVFDATHCMDRIVTLLDSLKQ